MPYGIFSLGFVCLATVIWSTVAWRVACRSRYKNAPLSIHPLTLISVFLWLVFVDFVVLFVDVSGDQLVNFSRRTISDTSEVSNAALVYALMLSSASAGLFIGGMMIKSKLKVKSVDSYLNQRSALMVFLIVLSLTIVLFVPNLISALRSGNILAIAGMRMVLAGKSELLALMMLMLAPAALLYANYALSNRHAYIVIGVTIIVYLLFGSRFNIIILIYGMVLIMPIRRHLNWPTMLACLPAAFIFLSFYAYLTRFTYAYDSYGEYLSASGGFFSSFFRSLEMSMAEAMTVHLNERLVDRSWYDSLLASFVALVPRELIPWKPYGLSAALTLAADPARWLLVRSEWTVGGFTNLVYEMGLLGGFCVCGVMFGVVGGSFIRLNREGNAVLWWPIYLVIILGFMRADVYNVGMKFWAIILMMGLYWMLKIVNARRAVE